VSGDDVLEVRLNERLSPSHFTGHFAFVMLAASLAAAPSPGQAQSETKLYRIGILTELRVEDHIKYWQDALRERGYIEGKNAIFEARGAAEKFDLLPKLAIELVQSNVDIILTASTPPAVAAKQVTSTIPIVTLSADPVGAGLVSSVAQPGGNVTGVYVPLVDMAAKRMQLLKEAVPGLTSVAILWNPRNSVAQLQAKVTETAAHSLRLTTFSVEVPSQSDLDGALQLLHAKHPSGFIVMQDPLMLLTAKRLAEFAIKNQLPAFHPYREFAEAGGLMSYGVSLKGLLELAAIYADKILKGAKPADLPMEQPSRYDFVINLRTAKSLGITIPESILLRADKVIR
jgi:putative ABC transport system substrate-binding protein